MSQHRNVHVQYAVKYETQTVTEAEYDLVHYLFNLPDGSGRVTAIKFIRLQYNLGLKEAKDVCEAIASKQRTEHSY